MWYLCWYDVWAILMKLGKAMHICLHKMTSGQNFQNFQYPRWQRRTSQKSRKSQYLHNSLWFWWNFAWIHMLVAWLHISWLKFEQFRCNLARQCIFAFPSWLVSKSFRIFKNQDDRRRSSQKWRKPQYLHNRLDDFDKILHDYIY